LPILQNGGLRGGLVDHDVDGALPGADFARRLAAEMGQQGCHVDDATAFKPENKAELQGAVNAWIADPTVAAIKYGPINYWDTSLLTDISSLFYQASAFNGDPHQMEHSRRDKHARYVS
jgi:hypothetical protein